MAEDDIKFGTVYSGLDRVIEPLVFAQRSEAMGFDSLWVTEVLLRGSLDPFTFLSAAAARTRSITLGTVVAVLPFRHPIQWVKLALSVDALSSGRLILGVGIGGEFPKELEMMGLDMRNRASISDETLEAMRRLLTESNITHEGKRFQFQDVTMSSPTGEKPHIPIWVGGEWHDGVAPGVLKRAARFGDGFVPVDMPFDAYGEVRQKIEAYASEMGRDPSSFEWAIMFWACLGHSAEAARGEAEEHISARLGFHWPLDNSKANILGTPRDFVDTIQRYVSAGVRHFIFNMACRRPDVMRQYQVIAREVIPHFKKGRGKP